MQRSVTNITWVGGLAILLLLLGSIGTAGCNAPQAEASGSAREAARTPAAAVERGKYLVNGIGCSDCHTPLKMGPKGPEPDMSRMLSGHPEDYRITAGAVPPSGEWQHGFVGAATSTAFSGPWGVSFAANLTPDQNTGLGIWTEDMFIKALRTGRHFGVSRPILPPMPWQNFARFSDEDLKAIWAYLRSLPPITNHVPDPIPPSPGTAH
jgi:mono/diheme cytochrome c family protein